MQKYSPTFVNPSYPQNKGHSKTSLKFIYGIKKANNKIFINIFFSFHYKVSKMYRKDGNGIPVPKSSDECTILQLYNVNVLYY